jgi:hypothetical protein
VAMGKLAHGHISDKPDLCTSNTVLAGLTTGFDSTIIVNSKVSFLQVHHPRGVGRPPFYDRSMHGCGVAEWSREKEGLQ